MVDRAVDVWVAQPEQIFDTTLLRKYESWLTPEEHDKHHSFVFERQRHEYLITRALVRSVLSRQTGVQPAQWRFARTEYDRPYVIAPDVPTPYFNLSNTDGLVVCATAPCRVGIDAELHTSAERILEVAETVFSDRELIALRALPAFSQLSRAVQLWTLKEAYLKAIGTGLSAPLRQFTVTVEGQNVSVDFDFDDEPAGWQASTHELGRHSIGLFVEKAGKGELSVRFHPSALSAP